MPVAPNRSGGGFAGLWPRSRCSQWFSIAGRMARDARLSATRSGTIICMIGRRQKLPNMTAMITLLVPLGLMACGSPEPTTPYLAPSGLAQPAPAEPQPQPQQPSTESLTTRLEALDRAVARWQGASTLRTAHEAAEEARNLVVGSSGPFYGDANGDGRISGASTLGILPGLKGERSLARRDDNACVVADVLGGSWREPAKRWSKLQNAIARWTAAANTFPALPSHPQRVVGWASLTLNSASLAEAQEYARHAQLHVDI